MSMQLLSVFLLALLQSATVRCDDIEEDHDALKAHFLEQFFESEGNFTSNFSASLGDPIKENDIQLIYANVIDAGNVPGKKRLEELVARMRPLFNALPKDSDGLLSYQTSRYAIHRHMMQERSWFIRGLESSDAASIHRQSIDSEWVVSYAHGLILQRSMTVGTNLPDLALIVATLEDLVLFDMKKRLNATYVYLGMSASEPQTKPLVQCAFEAFMFYTLAFDNIAGEDDRDPFSLPGTLSPAGRREKLCGGLLLPSVSKEPEVAEWSRQVLAAVGDAPGDLMSFSQASTFAYKFLTDYSPLQERDCHALKDVLVSLEGKAEGRKAGRVDVKSYHDAHEIGDFRFRETEEDLRRSGVLDEATETPYIVVSNYVGARTNCVESSGLFAFCCKIECDAILSNLELHLGAPAASASEIQAAIALLPSSVSAPQALRAGLLERLTSLEREHHGTVPIHSDAFSILLHEMFPRECPQPHPLRSSSFPMTAGEWLHEEGYVWAEDSAAEDAEGNPGAVSNAGEKTLLLMIAAVLALVWRALGSLGDFQYDSTVMQGLRGVLGASNVPVARYCCLVLACLSGVAALAGSRFLGQIVLMSVAVVVVRCFLYRMNNSCAGKQKCAEAEV
eukprot:TRINITY_DN3718_c0_g1_i6.p1 TRINITY_DN3718_c0_g1~~TRINITY_DN3718_c0_g1_i6.p1  ORF type:complete len:620 (-),score=110.65 TRINITY_DN3718_c0_g1_i6:85-1944(-)